MICIARFARCSTRVETRAHTKLKGNRSKMRFHWSKSVLTAFSSTAVVLAGCGSPSSIAGDDNQNGDDGFAGDGDAIGQSRQGWGRGWSSPTSTQSTTSSTSTSTTSTSTTSNTSSSCPNPDGANSVMAALAVATAKELGRWEPTTDFYVSGGELRLTSAGKYRCSDGFCRNTQALLDMQKSSSQGQVRISPTVTLNADALRSRLVAKFGEQVTCESQPDNHDDSDCPAEDHKLRFLYSSSGSCDVEFWFEATTPSGGALSYPHQLANKLLWVDRYNPYVDFQSSGNKVAIDPTYGLNEDGTTSSGSCMAACTKVTAASVAGQCCTCGGTKKFARSAFNASIYLCK
jgi:hypothetical protein